MHWDSQGSGIQIPNNVARQLEILWQDFLKSDRIVLTKIVEPSAIEGLRTETKIYVRGRSRQLRDLALENAKGICCVCDTDYKKVLNGKGVHVLQVHHRKQLAFTDTPRVTHLSDLAVVCANCHLLLHLDQKKAFDVEDLRRLLREK